MTDTIDLAEDLRRRYVPSQEAVDAAVDALTTKPGADVAVVPMYMPDKRYGIWVVGQPVETITLTGEDVLVATNSNEANGDIPSVRDRQNEAFELARKELAKHGKGITGYAVVRRNGSSAVFEEILSATD